MLYHMNCRSVSAAALPVFPGSRKLALAVAHILFLSAIAAQAQTTDAPSAGGEDVLAEVTVSSSRIVRDGYELPTPVTVIGPEQFEAQSPSMLVDIAKTLPQFKNVPSPEGSGTTTVNGGQSGLNLRGLGVNRNLVMLDGRRVAPSTANGRVDINTLPTALVDRIDVVTGGASAAWGSDAVSGVVNFILDTDYTGVKATAEAGRSEAGDNDQYQISLAGGADFHSGRGHVVFSVEQFQNDGVGAYARDWLRLKSGLVVNPDYTPTNGQAQRHLVEGIVSTTMTLGGLITGGRNANGSVNNSLRGIAFGPGGTPYVHQFGTYVSPTGNMVAPLRNGPYGYLDNYTTVTDGAVTVHPSDRKSFFGHLKYDVTDTVNAYVEISYTDSELGPYQTAAPFRLGTSPANSFVITADNAFLPDSVRQQMSGSGGGDPTGPASILIGRNAVDWGGFEQVWNWNRTTRAVAGLKGSFSGDWRWNAYYQYGINDYRNVIPRNAITSRNGDVLQGNMALAADAVFAPAGNAAGIPAGTIACRSTLIDPDNGCVPLNVFGVGTASSAAINYIYGEQWTTVEYEQHLVEGEIAGEPFSTWAGPVSFVVGAAYREDAAKQEADPLSIEGAFVLGNPKPFKGRDSVSEIFVETLVPLLKSVTFAERLDLNLAGRSTDYSSSGRVETWKAGLVYSPLASDELRFRVTRSRDIRAPSLDERFLGAQQFITTVVDPFLTPAQTVTPWRINVGNAALDPEVGDTWALGVVFRPDWLPGFSASVDYYDIELDGAITQISPQRTVDDCFAGNASLCSLLTRDANGVLVEIVQPFLNIASLKARGYDVEASYRVPLADSALALRALASHVSKFEESDGVTTTVVAGELNQPRWQGQLQAIYNRGQLTLAGTGQFFGGGRLSNLYTVGDADGNDRNHVGSRWYLNLNAAYAFEPDHWPNSELYFNVKNLTNKEPPFGIGFSGGAGGMNSFDLVGRMYKVGVRMAF